MTPQAELPNVDRVIFETSAVRVGAFRCPIDHPSFADSGPIRDHCFVFPRTPVVIQHKDASPFATDATMVTVYNRGQEYRRRAVSLDGDRCDWYAVADTLLRDALVEVDPAAADDCRRPIRFAFVRSDAATYWQQRQLFTRLAGDRYCDALEAEERVYELLDRILTAAYGSHPDASASRARRAAEDLAQAACELLGRRFNEPLTLGDIAADLDASVFHLCRSFRSATGTTLHAHRNQLRVRAALERLEQPDADLWQLALDLGYSSHSHFTSSFRRAFGTTPSAARQRLRARS